MSITIGIDPHKASHTAVAVDEFEYVLGHQVRRLGQVVTVGHIGGNSGWMSHFQVAPATGDGRRRYRTAGDLG